MFGSTLPAAAQQGKQPPVAIPGATAWKRPDRLQHKLANEIYKRLPEPNEEAVETFIKNTGNRRLLLMYHIARDEAGLQEVYRNHNNALKSAIGDKEKNIEQLEKEVKSKTGPEKKNAEFRLTSARKELKKRQKEAKHPINLEKNEKVLKAVLNDATWLEQIVFSGELHRFSRVVEIMSSIDKEDSAALKKGVERDTTTAVALEYARGNYRTTDAVARARHFLKYWRQGRLNTSYDNLPLHQRRIACGWKPEHRGGTPKAMEWALNNVHIPDWQYPSCCWSCGYIADNVYGDSVQGPWYFSPWEGVYTDNHMTLTRYVGGVCGGLSHFGATAACANGVPALASGEPGHCSYIVLVNGKWTPAYSLHWDRGLHWTAWGGNHTYSSLHMTDDLYAESSAEQTRLSNAWRILANVYRDKGDAEKTLFCYEQSAAAAPLNYPMWKEYSAFLAQQMPKNKDAWKKLHSLLNEGLVTRYPEQAALLLRQGILNSTAAAGMDGKEMTEICADFWKNAAHQGPDRWHTEQLADMQLQLCKKAGGNTEETAINFYIHVLGAAAAHDAYAGLMMSWGNKVSQNLSADGQTRLTNATIRVLTQGEDVSNKQKANLLRSFILQAERTGDVETFHALCKMIDPSEIHGTAAIPELPQFPGELVSEGGMPFASSTSKWDNPHTHSGLLTKSGGRIHTATENNPWIAVKLPKHATITGVVLVGTNEWKLIHRFRPVKVQVSETGQEGDWHDVGAPIPETPNYVISFNLQEERPKALYVRVLRPGGPEVFHANGIYVFGEPAA